MSFSPNQQRDFRTLVALAWRTRAGRENLPPNCPVDRDWYERQLFHATGHASSPQCDAGEDYLRAMAHFEALTGAGTQWQMRLHSDALQWLRRELTRDLGSRALQRCQVDEAYLLKALRDGFGAYPLWKLDRDELPSILRNVLRSVRRSIKHEIYTQDEKAEALGLWQQNGVWAKPA